MTTIESELLMIPTQTDATTRNGRFSLPADHLLTNLREHMYDSQDPFTVLAELDPATDWTNAATKWSARALEQLRGGQKLELSFSESFLGNLMSSSGVVLWQSEGAEAVTQSNDPGLALLRENPSLRDPSGRHHLYIPGQSISALRTRVHSENQPIGLGKSTPVVKRIVDLQIKTSADKPSYTFSRTRLADGTKLRPIESNGRWFKLPLDQVQLVLI